MSKPRRVFFAVKVAQEPDRDGWSEEWLVEAPTREEARERVAAYGRRIFRVGILPLDGRSMKSTWYRRVIERDAVVEDAAHA
jgi:hypothetical protein